MSTNGALRDTFRKEEKAIRGALRRSAGTRKSPEKRGRGP